MAENELEQGAQGTGNEGTGDEDKYPNRTKYEDGYVFNYPVAFYEGRTEQQVEDWIRSGGTEDEHIGPHMDLIREALDFHGTKFGTPPSAESAEGEESTVPSENPPGA